MKVAPVDLGLGNDSEAVFDAKLHSLKRLLFGSFSVSHPVVAAKPVEGYLYLWAAAEFPEFAEHLLVYKAAVCI